MQVSRSGLFTAGDIAAIDDCLLYAVDDTNGISTHGDVSCQLKRMPRYRRRRGVGARRRMSSSARMSEEIE